MKDFLCVFVKGGYVCVCVGGGMPRVGKRGKGGFKQLHLLLLQRSLPQLMISDDIISQSAHKQMLESLPKQCQQRPLARPLLSLSGRKLIIYMGVEGEVGWRGILVCYVNGCRPPHLR